MKVTQEEVVDRQTVLNLEVEEEDLSQYLDRGYRRLVQRMQIPGFRKGKAPRRIVEQYVGREGLLNEVLDYMLPELTNRAIEEQNVDAAGLPRIELVEIDPLKVKATVPLAPEVELGPYRDIRIAEETDPVSDEDAEARLEELRSRLASWEPVERPSLMGDMVTMKIVGAVGERTLLDDDSAVFILDEEGTRPTPDFAANLIGLSAAESKDFTVTLPEDYPDKSVAGEEARFSVTVDEIKGRVLPELDDEFAKSAGDGHEDLESLRQKLREDLEAEAAQRSDMRLRETVVKAVVGGATVALPPLIVEHEVAHMEEEQAKVLERANIRMVDYLRSIGKTEEDMRKELEEQALQKLNSALVLTKVGELEHIEVSDDEVEERLKSITAGSDDESVQDGLSNSVRRMLTTEKTIGSLLEIAKGEAGSSEAEELSEEPAGEDEPGEEAGEDESNEEKEEAQHDGGSVDDTST